MDWLRLQTSSISIVSLKITSILSMQHSDSRIIILSNISTMESLNSGYLRVLKNLTVSERCLLLGGNFKKIVTFGTKRFVRYSMHVRYLGCPLLGGFTVLKLLAP